MHTKSPVEIIYSHKQCPRSPFLLQHLQQAQSYSFCYSLGLIYFRPKKAQSSLRSINSYTKAVETYTLWMDVLEVLLHGPTVKPIPNVHHTAGRTIKRSSPALLVCRNTVMLQWYCFLAQISEQNHNHSTSMKPRAQTKQEQKVPATTHPLQLEAHRGKPHCRYPA